MKIDNRISLNLKNLGLFNEITCKNGEFYIDFQVGNKKSCSANDAGIEVR